MRKMLKLPRKIKKAYKNNMYGFYDGWYPMSNYSKKNLKWIDKYVSFFIKIDSILNNENHTEEDEELLRKYWVYHFGIHIRRQYNKRVKH